MKNVLIIIGILFLFSFTAVDGSSYHAQRVAIPLKQKRVVVVRSEKLVAKYLQIGFVCTDVDFVVTNRSAYTSNVVKYYTLIKY